MAVHDDDLRRAGRLRAAYSRVDLLGIEPAPFLVHRLAAGRLLPLDDACDAFHVADDVHLHADAPCLAASALDRISPTISVFESAYCCTYFQSRARELPLRSRVALAVGFVRAQPVAKQQHPVRLFTAGRKDVEIDVRVRTLEDPVLEPLRLADHEDVARPLEVGQVRRLVRRVGDLEHHVDDRLGGQRRHRRRACVLQSHDPGAEHVADAHRLALEPHRPFRVVLDDVDPRLQLGRRAHVRLGKALVVRLDIVGIACAFPHSTTTSPTISPREFSTGTVSRSSPRKRASAGRKGRGLPSSDLTA